MDLNNIIPGLKVDTNLATKPSFYGEYTKVAEVPGTNGSLWLNVVGGPGWWPYITSEGTKKNVRATGAAVRVRIYGGSSDNNPFPGFKTAKWDGSDNEAPYWKVKQFFIFKSLDFGIADYVSFFKGTFTPDAIKALTDVVEAAGGKFTVEPETLRAVIEKHVDTITLDGDLPYYKGVTFGAGDA
jgi:hypothetical protein